MEGDPAKEGAANREGGASKGLVAIGHGVRAWLLSGDGEMEIN